MVNIGFVIKTKLRQARKTQAWLAEAIGVSNNAVSKWVKTGKISRENIPKLARLLAVSVNDLLPENGEAINRVNELESIYNVSRSHVVSESFDERELLNGYRVASNEIQEMMLMMARKAISINAKKSATCS